jgi:hypothetical protein
MVVVQPAPEVFKQRKKKGGSLMVSGLQPFSIFANKIS